MSHIILNIVLLTVGAGFGYFLGHVIGQDALKQKLSKMTNKQRRHYFAPKNCGTCNETTCNNCPKETDHE